MFGFRTFRPFPKLHTTIFGKQEITQRDIVEASLRDESFLAILPTGGGKTFTFWLPAIIKEKSYKALTVVISPLQALIKTTSQVLTRKSQTTKLLPLADT